MVCLGLAEKPRPRALEFAPPAPVWPWAAHCTSLGFSALYLELGGAEGLHPTLSAPSGGRETLGSPEGWGGLPGSTFACRARMRADSVITAVGSRFESSRSLPSCVTLCRTRHLSEPRFHPV